jgi:antitoxin (DNA-binding transcriptional repressor) of toxin-antitoxin stability system
MWTEERMKARTRKKPMQEIAISEFKAKCLALLEQVSKTNTPLRILKRGKPIVDVFPALPASPESGWMGSMSGSIEIIGDIVSPVIELTDIEALKN